MKGDESAYLLDDNDHWNIADYIERNEEDAVDIN